ncbi:unnamed protein product [marine sediment metagenome]|uniref:Uncharacterized protein n=1 Tax=marine sediment metagenome TaxID=412755 RepID=X1M5E9_9ZZZZ
MPRYTLESLMAETGGPSMVEAAGPGPMTAVKRQWRAPGPAAVAPPAAVQQVLNGGGGYVPPGAGIMAGAAPAGLIEPSGLPVQPGVMAAIPAAAAAAGISLPAWLAPALGIAAAGYAGYQALGGGEGGGLFGLNVLGGDEFAMGGLEFGGPGLAEPLAPYTEWRVGNKQFYYVKVLSPTTGKFLRQRWLCIIETPGSGRSGPCPSRTLP